MNRSPVEHLWMHLHPIQHNWQRLSPIKHRRKADMRMRRNLQSRDNTSGKALAFDLIVCVRAAATLGFKIYTIRMYSSAR